MDEKHKIVNNVSGVIATSADFNLLKFGLDSPSDIIIIFLDKEYKYLYFNKYHQRVMLLAYGVEVSLNKCILNFITNPEDRINIKKNYDRVLAGESHTSVEEYGKTERAWYETRYNPIRDESGAIIGVSAFSFDVTSRIKSENQLHESSRRFRIAIDNFPYEFIILDPQLKVLYANKLALDCTRKSFPEMIGQSLNEIEDPDFVSKNIQLQKDVIGRKVPISKSIELGNLENHQVYKITYVPVLDANKEIREIFRILIDVTNIRRKENQLRALSNQLELLREEERHRISRDIHDDLGQILTALKIDLVTLQKKSGGNNDLIEELKPIVGLVDSAIDSARRVSFELRPGILDQTGLIPAIEWLLTQSKKHSNIEYKVSLPETGILEIDTEKSVAIYRVLQEILTNISRHANASIVDISLTVIGDSVQLAVTDNGKGFDFNTHSESLGLLGMKERARIQKGSLDVQSGPEGGTTIKLIIPI